MIRVFEYRLRPNSAQEKLLNTVLEDSRIMYNNALTEWKDHLNNTGKYLSRFTQDKGYNTQTYPTLPAQVADRVLARLHDALNRFFKSKRAGGKRKGFPRYKTERQWKSIGFNDFHYALHGKYFHAGKKLGGKIRTVVHRPLDGNFKQANIVKRASGWYLLCVCEVKEKPLPKTGKSVGIDMGILSIIADSDGNTIENPRRLGSELKNLAHSQRIISRRMPKSGRLKKQSRIIARRYERISNKHKDFLNKASKKYVEEYDVICIEDLNIHRMVRNHHLSRVIMDASWYTFRHMLEYKAESAGKRVIAVNPRYTSQICSSCGEYVEKSLSTRTHMCPNCGYVDDRDVNAAKNILRIGLDEANVDCRDSTG